MKITKISFAKTVESSMMGAGVWVKIGVEADVAEFDSVAESIDMAKEVVNAAHEKEQAGRKQQGDIFFNVTTQKEER